jgi:ABC-2 type transport system permease protein
VSTGTLSVVRDTLRALPAMLRVGFAEALAYRAEFLIWILAYTMPAIMLALWSEVASSAPIGRFGPMQLRAYFLAALVVRLATGAWVVWELNTEVRQGTLSQRLLRPVHPIIAYLAENVAALPMRLAITLVLFAACLPFLADGSFTRDPLQLALVVPSLVGAFLLTFLVMACVGTLALFWESSLSVYDLWLSLYTVLSGYVMPLEFFPEGVRGAVRYLPFRSMMAFPVENMLGLVDRRAALTDLALQWGWVALFLGLLVVTWRAGMRRFQAFGG